MNNTIKPELDALYTLRNDLKLALIHQIIINDFDSSDTNKKIRALVAIQVKIDRIEGSRNEQNI